MLVHALFKRTYRKAGGGPQGRQENRPLMTTFFSSSSSSPGLLFSFLQRRFLFYCTVILWPPSPPLPSTVSKWKEPFLLRSVGLPSSWPSPSDREVFACNRAGGGRKVVGARPCREPGPRGGVGGGGGGPYQRQEETERGAGRFLFWSDGDDASPSIVTFFFAPLFIPLRTEGRRRGQPSPGPQRSSVFLQLLPRDTVSPFFPLPANGSLCTRAQVRKLYRESSARSDAIKC